MRYAEIGYPAARTAAPAVEAFFAARPSADEPVAPVPDAATIEAIVDAAFWAGLRQEEGRSPRISLAYLPHSLAGAPLTFAEPIPLDPAALARLAPAVEQPGMHLGVWRQGDELVVWGAARTIPRGCFVLEVVQPGLLVVKHRRGQDVAKFRNVAVLDGDRIRMVDEEGASLPDCPSLVESLLGFYAPADWGDSLNVLVQLAVAMRTHGRGGSLLIVPAEDEAWRESIVRPVRYAVSPRFSALANLVRRQAEGASAPSQDQVVRAVETIAGLTAVDGATILSQDYELLAFGAKIERKRGSDIVERVTLTEPVIGNTPIVLPPAELGGTRHLSAAQFVHDQHGALVLVASQDSAFTVFAWSPCEEMVHAHRVEVLLL